MNSEMAYCLHCVHNCDDRGLLDYFLLLHCWGCLRLNLLNTYMYEKKKQPKQKHKGKQKISTEASASIRLLLATALHTLKRPNCCETSCKSRCREENPSNLCRNDFGHCTVCYTVKCFVQFIPPQCRQNIATKHFTV